MLEGVPRFSQQVVQRCLCLSPAPFFSFKSSKKVNMHLLPQQRRPQELTDQQKLFLELFELDFDVDNALHGAGYSPNYKYKIVKRFSEEILGLTQSYLALHSPNAAKQIVERMKTGGVSDGASKAKFEAAKEVLDRVGIGKKEIVHHEGEVVHGVVLLPAKTEKVIDADFQEA